MNGTVYLTASELAGKLGLHVKTVYANREIPRVEIGGSVRFIESEVDAYIRTRTTRKAAPRKRVMRRNFSLVEVDGNKRTDSEAS
jgi:excisionase family DNA binding protein